MSLTRYGTQLTRYGTQLSIINENREGGELNLAKKCVMKTSEACNFKPQEGKWVYVDYGSQMWRPGEYLQPMLLNTVLEPNLRESKFSPRAGNKKSPAIYMVNLNNFLVQLRRGETLGTLVWLRASQEDKQDGGRVRAEDGWCHSCSASLSCSTQE